MFYLSEQSPNHDEEIRSRKATQARIRRNRQRGLDFEEEMFDAASRYLVLHLTLNYKAKFRDKVTPELSKSTEIYCFGKSTNTLILCLKPFMELSGNWKKAKNREVCICTC